MIKSSAKAVFLVLSTVALGLVSASCLKEAAQVPDISISTLILAVGVVIMVNGGRFMIWGYMHKCYPLSFSYPLTSLFFPAIFVMSYYYGEPLGVTQFLGVVLITSGVAILAYGENI